MIDAPSYDYAKRRKTKRAGRERGCWVYISAEELQAAGIDPQGETPWYRAWGTKRGGVMLRLYKKP